MRNFDKECRIQATSLPEIAQEFESLRVHLRRGKKINGRAILAGPFLNAILVYFFDLPEEEQVAAFDYGRRRVEALLEGEERQGDWEKPARVEAVMPPRGGRGGVQVPAKGDPAFSDASNHGRAGHGDAEPPARPEPRRRRRG